MKKRTGSILAIVVVAIVIFAIYYAYYGKAVEVTPTQFGSWKQQILVEFPDGSTSQIASLAVVYGGEEVVALRYILSAKSSQSGVSTLKVNLASYTVKFTMSDATYVKDHTVTFTESPSVPVNGQWNQLVEKRIPIESLDTGAPAGTYQLSITPMGETTYAYDSSPFETCSLPNSFTTSLTVQETTPPPPGGEDLTTYTKYDPKNYLAVVPNKVVWTDMPRTGESYIQKAKSISMDDFSVNFKAKATRFEPNPLWQSGGVVGAMVAMLFTNREDANTIGQCPGDYLRFTWRAYTSNSTGGETRYLMRLERRNAGQSQAVEYTGALNTDYDITISRTGTTAKMVIMTGGAQVFSRTITDVTDIQWYTALCGRNTGSSVEDTMYASGSFWDITFS